MTENTFVMIKPDAVMRGLIGDIIIRLERKGLQLVACKLVTLSDDVLKLHYQHLADKPFFPRLSTFMKSAPVLVQCWRGPEAVEVVRNLAGATNGRVATAGTIRGDYSVSIQCNLIHASDSLQAAREELVRFFEPQEILSYDAPNESFVTASSERG